MSTYLVGTYTADMDGSAEGILALRSASDGSLQLTGVAAVAASPSFLARDGDTVYAVAEGAGRVAEYTLNGADLTLISEASSGGEAPCHIGVYGSSIVVSNYTDGALGVLGTSPLALTQTLAGEGSGPHSVQEGPHAHATFEIGGALLSADLGADRVHVHSLVDGVLERGASLALPPGTGPRDFLRHPAGDLYLLGELGLDVTVLRWAAGELVTIASVALPGGADGDHAAGLSLAGDYLYATLRGSNRISVLRAGEAGLEPVGFVSSEGDWPRHHAVEGSALHVANQLSSEVASFSIGDDGLPALLGITAVPSPTFLLRAERF